jgi:hypothetical protein
MEQLGNCTENILVLAPEAARYVAAIGEASPR